MLRGACHGRADPAHRPPSPTKLQVNREIARKGGGLGGGDEEDMGPMGDILPTCPYCVGTQHAREQEDMLSKE